jgi:hypothetical protein
MRLSAGSRLGPYEVLAPLGAGGMGEVYRARDPRLGRDVALKIVATSAEGQADRFRRFEQEARAVAALNHPNVLAVYDVGSESGTAYVVFELLEGQTLRERLEAGTMPARKAVDYGVQIAHGLAAAHARGIIHRDLKPENVFVTSNGPIKVLDFGLAKLKEADADLADAVTRTATDDGTVVGTAGYMSPEQARGKTAEPRSDVFALGAVLYEMLSGRPAFGGETRTDRLAAILRQDPPELGSATREPVSPALESVVRRCLEKDPEERFQSARDVAFALEALAGESTRDKVVASAPAPRRWWKRAAAVVALPCVGAAALLASRDMLERPLPSFRQLTFRRGAITGARFASDERTVVYSAAWDGRPSAVFTTRLDAPDSRSLGLPPARLLSVSSRGELALLLAVDGEVGYPAVGTLARVPLAGGVPRLVHEEVLDADWGPDGRELALIRKVNGQAQLELPLGTVLWSRIPGCDGGCSLRLSPSGDKVAVLAAALTIVDRSGSRRSLEVVHPARGLAWAPTGDALFVRTGGAVGTRSLHRLGLDGSSREIHRLPGEFNLLDVAKSGAVLLDHGFERWGIRVKPRGDAERDLDVLSSTAFATSVSTDGRQVVVFEQSRDGVYLYSVAGGEPVILDRGYGGRLSPDGKWVLTPPHGPDNVARLLPLGAGEPRLLPLGKLQETGGDFLDAGHIYWGAREGEGAERGYVQDVATGAIRPVTPEGIRPLRSPLVQGAVLGRRTDETLVWCPIDGGEPRPTRVKLPSDEHSLTTTKDGMWMFVGSGAVPHRIDRVNLVTGRREAWKVLGPPDLAGVVFMPWFFAMRPDGEVYAYSYLRAFHDLYLAEGLR